MKNVWRFLSDPSPAEIQTLAGRAALATLFPGIPLAVVFRNSLAFVVVISMLALTFALWIAYLNARQEKKLDDELDGS